MASLGRGNKIFKEGGAKPDAFEELVAGAIFDLQVQTDMKADLQDLFITSATEVDVGSRKAIIIHVPFRLLTAFHRIQQRLIRELEKKFSGKHVTIIAQRRILPREVLPVPARFPSHKSLCKRPSSDPVPNTVDIEKRESSECEVAV